MLVKDPPATIAWPSLSDKHGSGVMSSTHSVQVQMGSGNSQSKKPNITAQTNFDGLHRKDAYGGLDLQPVTPSGMVVERRRQIYSQVTGPAMFISS